jgi:SAM-dependent methyltransferase
MLPNNSSLNPTERFSDRAQSYLKFRPHYPREIIPYLIATAGLSKEDVVADIGSGTGFLSELFLEQGNIVYGVEPNKEMREAGESYLNHYSNFRSISGTAEHTPLRDHSIDFVVAGQAFHWFEPEPFRRECARMLRNKAIVCLVWNQRDFQSTKFLQEYEDLLKKYSEDYQKIRHDNITRDDLQSFFGAREINSVQFPYIQHLDFDGLKGRLLSSSYVPMKGHPLYEEMLGTLEQSFITHNKDGKIELVYVTKVYWSTLA